MKTPSSPLSSAAPVRLHIERLVLEGLPLASHQLPAFQDSFEHELAARLIGTPTGFEHPDSVSRPLMPVAVLSPGAGPGLLGRLLARTLATALARGRESSRERTEDASSSHRAAGEST